MGIRTCFAMVVTSNFLSLAQVALRSLRINSELDIPFHVFCTDQDDRLSIDGEIDALRVLYNDLTIHKVDALKYQRNNKGLPYYWCHEIFNLQGYDRVIFVDADMICLGSLADLPDEVDIGMVFEVPRKQFNTGFISVGKKYLNPETYEAIFKHQKRPETFGRDQAVYNEYFDKSEVTELPVKYNTLTNSEGNDIRMLHYIYKPGLSVTLAPKYQKLWDDHALAVSRELKESGYGNDRVANSSR